MSHATHPGVSNPLGRRHFLRTAALMSGGLWLSRHGSAAEQRRQELAHDRNRALIGITLDMEMSRNFPTWETTHWDYEKGNLNAETKKYCVDAGRRVKARGGLIHYFAVGQVLEQENVDWLQELACEGHPIGNHTYDHVYVLATKLEDVQFRFKRAPWLVAGQKPAEVIRENILRANLALKTRLGIDAAGFRTPGGFAVGLNGRPDVQQMFLELDLPWISCKAVKVDTGPAGSEPGREVFEAIVRGQPESQPFTYPSGLIDVPMSPITDVHAFCNSRWKLDWFLKAIRTGVEWAIENRAVYDFVAHPSVLYPMDPEFRAIDLICELVNKAGKRATLVDLGTMALRAKPATKV